jgi:hypothetical protein
MSPWKYSSTSGDLPRSKHASSSSGIQPLGQMDLECAILVTQRATSGKILGLGKGAPAPSQRPYFGQAGTEHVFFRIRILTFGRQEVVVDSSQNGLVMSRVQNTDAQAATARFLEVRQLLSPFVLGRGQGRETPQRAQVGNDFTARKMHSGTVATIKPEPKIRQFSAHSSIARRSQQPFS